ncbi:MAG: nucleotide pyrophosphohydrolase [Syntrophomonadaceae bacterium]|nr:nucleotide pyrophosphohydrolase [Syntrophomonadaceae bacterium]
MDIKKIMEKLIEFRDDRDFKRFHTTKNLTMSICIQAAKLLETFQWRDDEKIKKMVNSEKKTEIEEKVADIMIYLMYLCNNLEISSDRMEATIYTRIIKESSNMQLTRQPETPENIPKAQIYNFNKEE